MDYLIQGLAREGRVRVIACQTTDLVEEARVRQDSYATSSAALGRVLSVGAMMAGVLKNDEKITISINGQGPIGSVVVDANSKGQLRGFVGDPHVYLVYNDTGKLAVGKAVGNEGTLSVIKDLGMKEPYTGQVDLISGEIGEDFAYYFTVSEQLPSVVSVGVLVAPEGHIVSSGGLIIQMMPDATEEDIVYVEEKIKDLKPISSLIEQGQTPELIVQSLFEDMDILDTKPLTYYCNCSKERSGDAIKLLGSETIEDMIQEDHGCVVNCQFCGKEYAFSESELLKIKGE